MAQGRIRKVALIGTGIMGAPIGGHILDAGYDLTVHNRTKKKAEGLLARGAKWADSPAAASADADLILTMVSYPDDVEDVYLGTNGVLLAAKEGAWMVDLSTSSPDLARELHDAAEAADKHSFDCPVTGGEQGAKDGTLTLIAGVSPSEAEPVVPVLKTFSKKIEYFGRAGDGQTVKLCNQVSLASCMVGYADALALAEQSGIDRTHLLAVMNAGTGGSNASRSLGPRSVAGDYKAGFKADHLRKDLELALMLADDLELTLPGAETANILYDTLCQIGGANLGTQAITLLYEDDATCEAAGLDLSDLAPRDSENVSDALRTISGGSLPDEDDLPDDELPDEDELEE